jgi:vesicular inhibitory amino acid transporter
LTATVGLILNVYIGLGLLSQPYAVKLGGWAGGLSVLAVTIASFTTSALLLPKAFALLPPGIPHSYPQLGAFSLGGGHGKVLVASLAGMELFGSLAIALCVVYRQLELLLPAVSSVSPATLAAAVSCAALAPLLAARDVSRVAPLSALGSSASFLVVAAVAALPLLDPGRLDVPRPAERCAFKFPGVLQSLGIFAASSSGHSVLPALRGAMRDPGRFPRAVLAAFAVMGGIYALVGSIGYFYWGETVSAVLVVDLSAHSPFAAAAGGTAPWRRWLPPDRALAALVLVNCAGKVAALVMVVQDLVTGLLLAPPPPAGGPHGIAVAAQPRPQVRYAVRLAIMAAAAALSYAARDVLGTVLSLVGGFCSLATSLVLPTLFYARLTWRRQGRPARAALAAGICVGVALLLTVTALNVLQIFFAKG